MGWQLAAGVIAAIAVIAIIGAAYWMFSMPIDRYSGWPTSLRIPYRLANGGTVMVYPGEEIIDNTKGSDMQAKNIAVYVNKVFLGLTSQNSTQYWHDIAGASRYQLDFFTGYPDRIEFSYVPDAFSPALVRAVIAELGGARQPTLKEAAQAFESAINSEPGIEAKIVSIGAHDIGAVLTHTKWSVKVTRNERKQVYP